MASGADVPLVLVTGVSGYIGSHVAKLLLEEGHRVRGAVRNPDDEVRVKPLKDLCPNAAHPLELVQADLTKADDWKEAVKDCTYVIHVASPMPLVQPSNEDEVLKPAIEGTKTVLGACAEAGTVKRVVLTSSCLAVHDQLSSENGKVYNEADWTNVDRVGVEPYPKSKVLAEKAAWDFVKELPDEKKFELAVINPGLVIGPIVHSHGASIEVIKRLLDRSMPMVPRLNLIISDVRDVAEAHLKAMLQPEAAGQRHIVTTQSAWFKDLAQILSKEFKPQGYSVPTMTAPYLAIWLSSIFDKSLKFILPRVGHECKFDNTRMKEVLGITPRELNQTVIETAYSLIERGLVKKSKKSKQGKKEAAPAEEKQVNGEVEGTKETEDAPEKKDEQQQQQPEEKEPKMEELEPEDKEKPITKAAEQKDITVAAEQ